MRMEGILGRISGLTRSVPNGRKSRWTSFGLVCRRCVVHLRLWDSADLAKELPNLPPAKTPLESARNGYEYYKHLQAHDGHWPGEYGGPMFLIPGLTIGSYITGIPFTGEERLEMIRYLMNHANEDGGWGMYVSHHL